MKLNTLNVNHKQLMTYKKKLLPLPIPTEAQCISEYGEITDNELQELLNIKKTRAYLLTRLMHENGLIDIIGKGAYKKYKNI